MNCPCGSNAELAQCCGPLLDGNAAATALDLMRSRYVAYALGRFDYILETTDPQHRADVPTAGVRAWMDEAEFTGLEIVTAHEDGPRGVVEFIARYTTASGPQMHHEVSRFRKSKGRWFFRAGKIVQS